MNIVVKLIYLVHSHLNIRNTEIKVIVFPL